MHTQLEVAGYVSDSSIPGEDFDKYFARQIWHIAQVVPKVDPGYLPGQAKLVVVCTPIVTG